MSDDPLPIACVGAALTPEQRARYRELAGALAPEIQAVRETEDGFAFELGGGADTRVRAMEFATLERLCCPFLTFCFTLAPPGHTLVLALSGPPGTREVLAEELSWLRSPAAPPAPEE